MAFNRSYIAFDDWGFEPTYFVGLDHVVNNDNKANYRALIDHSRIERFFFSKDPMSITHLTSDKTTLIDIDETDPLHPGLDFSSPLKVSNSGLFGLQVALGLLAFKEVYLLGCDANYAEVVEGVDTIDGKYVSHEDRDCNHFREDYYGKGTTYNKPENLTFHLPAWRAFFEAHLDNNRCGYRVFNCSRSGNLTFFPFADFDEVVGTQVVRASSPWCKSRD